VVAYLYLAVIVVSVALIAIILLQGKGVGLGGLTGGDFSGSGYHVRRGLEKLLFNVTIVLSALFFILAMAAVIAQP
jgi:preprotein translocase subunit SecG